jgi:hypothetical protein
VARKKTKRAWPTPEEARRALYIDFEGRKGQPPVLLGRTRMSKVRHAHSVIQSITDPSLRPLGEAEGLRVETLSRAVESILMQAEKGSRLIVAWSNHELNVIERDCPEHLERLKARYVNARTLMVNWRNSRHRGRKPNSNTLPAWFAYLRYPVPEVAGPGQAGRSIKVLQDALAKPGGGVERLTDKQRARWEALIAHNDHDCAGMRRIFVRAADEMAGG